MRLFAVTGNPILFSKSPEIFNFFFQKNNIDAKYFRLSANSTQEVISLFNELGLEGMNVTAPFKTDIIPFLDEIDEISKQIGAVNTVIRKDGKLLGFNTDYYGVVNTLKEVTNKNVVILGAGGAAKAVAYSLKEKVTRITIINRTLENAKKLAEQFDVEYCNTENIQATIEKADIIVNTLPPGIKVIEDDYFHSKQIIFDAIYHNSAYQRIAEEKQIQFYSGEDWLINQAIVAMEHFVAIRPKFEDIEFSKSKPKDKIIFTGFMGSGKSWIGREVSKKLESMFFSTDDIISTKEGTNINEIFSKYGEPYFRKNEQEALKMLASMSGKAIVSSGGGLVLDAANRALLEENYTVIWLYANVDNIMERTDPKDRPLLKDNFNKEFVSKLMTERKAFYAKSADILINTNNKKPDDLINKILKELSLK